MSKVKRTFDTGHIRDHRLSDSTHEDLDRDDSTPVDSIPYTLQFGQPRPVPSKEHQKGVRWIANHADYLTPYLGLRAKLSQSVLNSLCKAMICTTVLLAAFFEVISGGIDNTQSFFLLTCETYNYQSTGYSSVAALNRASQMYLNGSMTTAFQQGINDVNASLWNARSAAGQHLTYLVQQYGFADSALASAQMVAAQNATTSLSDWGDNILSEYSNMTSKLVRALSGVSSALDSSDMFSASSVNGSLQNLLSEQMPRDINSQLVVAAQRNESSDLSVMLNSVDDSLSKIFDRAAVSLGLVYDKAVNSGYINLSSLASPRSPEFLCDSITDHFDEVRGRARAATVAIIVALSILMVVATAGACVLCYFEWQSQLRISKEIVHALPGNTVDSMELQGRSANLPAHWIGLMLQGLFKGPNSQVQAAWFCNFVLSREMAGILLIGFWVLLLSGFQSSIVKAASSVPRAFDVTVNGTLPSGQLYNASNSLVSTISDLNSAIRQSQDSLSQDIDGVMVPFVTDLSTLLDNTTATVQSQLQRQAQSLNYSLPDFPASQLFSNGLALAQLSFPQFDQGNHTHSITNSSSMSFSRSVAVPNELATAHYVWKITGKAGLALVVAWFGLSLIGLVAAVIRGRYA